MDAEQLRAHWALILASAAGLVLLVIATRHIMRSSARGQLRRMCKELDRERKRLRKATTVAEKAERRRARLMQRADRVKPRVLQESSEAVADANALAKIAHDRVLVAENHLRRVILEEFPPAEHERLRSRYLPEERKERKPFTF